MKMKAFTKGIMVALFVFMGSMFAQAVTPKTYIYDTKEEAGKIVSKTVYLQSKGALNKEMMYEYKYNDADKVSEKMAYRWNKVHQDWEPFFMITYEYENENDIISNYSMWDAKKKTFSLNPQRMVLSASSYEDIFS